MKSGDISDKIDVEFTNKGVQITHYNFEVPCDFTTVNVTHTFENGVLHITQQGSTNQEDCVCCTDVSYTIDGIVQNEVYVIYINGKQVYCHIEKNDEDIDPINVQYIEKFGSSQGVAISTISAKNELEQYYESYVKCIYNSPTGQFIDATEIYSDDFFANNFLVIVQFSESSGSISHKVEKIDKNGNIIISRFIPKWMTHDIKKWIIIIELNNSFMLEQFRPVFVEKLYEM